MSIDLNCPQCGTGLSLPDEMAGRKIRCLDCGDVMRVPSAIPAPAPTFEAAPTDVAPVPAAPLRPRPIPAAMAEPTGSAQVPATELPLELDDLDPLAARRRTSSSSVAIAAVAALLVVAGVGGFFLMRHLDSDRDGADSSRPRRPPVAANNNVPGADPPRPAARAVPNPQEKPIVVAPAESTNAYGAVARLARQISLNRLPVAVTPGPRRTGPAAPVQSESLMELMKLSVVTDPVAVSTVAKLAADDLRSPGATLSPGASARFTLADHFDPPDSETRIPAADRSARLWRERQHRVYWSRLAPTLAALPAKETAGPAPFRLEIAPVESRGTSRVHAVCRLHNDTPEEELTDLIVRATFHDLWGGSVTNHYYFDRVSPGDSVVLIPGLDWGPHGLSHTVRVELQLWSQEATFGAWTQEFPNQRREAVASTLQIARQKLDESGDFGPAAALVARIRPVLNGDLATPEFTAATDDVEQRARDLERQRTQLTQWVHADAKFEGRWTFGAHQGPLGALFVPRDGRQPDAAAPSILGGANQIEIQIYDPAAPPQYKTLSGEIRYSDERGEYFVAVSGRWNEGIAQRPGGGSQARVEIDTMQLLLASDHRDFDLRVTADGDLVGTDSLGGKVHLIPRAADDAEMRIAALLKSDLPRDDPSSWRTIDGFSADLLPRERIRAVDGKYRVGEIKRFYAVPERVTLRSAVRQVGFFHRKLSGFAVLGNAQSLFWDFDRDAMIGARPLFSGAVLSSDDRWIVRHEGPNIIGIDQSVLGAPDARFTAGAFSPDSKRILVGNAAGKIAAWPVGGDQPLFDVVMSRPITAVAFDDNKRIFGAADDFQISIWDLPSKEAPKFFGTYRRHRFAVRSIFVSSDGKRVFSVADSTGFGPPPNSLAGSQSRSTVEVHLWDVVTQQTLHKMTLGQSPTAWAISPDWKYALVAEPDHYIYLWDLVEGRESARFLGHLDAVTALAFAPGNRFALSGGADQWVVMWGLPVD